MIANNGKICIIKDNDESDNLLGRLTTNLKIFYSEKAFVGNFRFPIRRCFGSAGKITTKAFSFGEFMPKEIKLTQGQVAIIDDADFARVSQYKWYAQRWKLGFYAVRNVYIPSTKKTVRIYLHRFLINAADNHFVDHINRNTLDNRKENLRIVNRTQNRANSTKHVRNTSGFKGVYKDECRWRARIRIGNKLLSLGSFTTAEDAAKAYDAKARELYGEFAYQNITEVDNA